MNKHKDKGIGFTHHDDTDCCTCPCKSVGRSIKVKYVGIKHSESRRAYWRKAQQKYRAKKERP